MRASTKRKVSTVIGVALGAATFTGPLVGSLLNDWQHERGLCGCWSCERRR